MRARMLFAAIAAGSAIGAMGMTSAGASVGDPGKADVVVATAAAGERAYFPDITRLHDGQLIAVYREGTDHVSQDGRILLSRSRDGGKHWSTPVVAVDTSLDERDPKITQLRDGTVLLNFFISNWDVTPNESGIAEMVVRSTDDARHWSEPVQIGDSLHGTDPTSGWRAGHGEILQLPNGDLLAPLYGKRGTKATSDAIVVRSTDGGRTWPVQNETVIAAASDVNFQEPVLTRLPGGQVVSFVRTDIGWGYVTRSNDNGHTWSAPQKTTIPASSHHLLQLPTGAILLTYGDLSKKYTTGRPTVGRLIVNPWAAWDAQPSYTHEQLLYDSGVNGGPTSDQANPSSAEVAPGRFITLTYDTYSRQIVGVFSSLKDYLGS